jgi:hypothetical protein
MIDGHKSPPGGPGLRELSQRLTGWGVANDLMASEPADLEADAAQLLVPYDIAVGAEQAP